MTSTNPQVVTYTINPKATWSTSGRPITWEDFAAQASALNGKNPAYVVSGTTGYEQIAKVERGADDKQAVVTFASPFGEWESLFSPLYPKETNADPNVFNTGWVDKPLDTAGPFKIGEIDKTAKTVTLVRDEKWWGPPAPKLSRLIFKVLERNAFADAMANNEIDYFKIASSADLFARAKAIPGVSVRQGPDPTYNHITFNGAPTSILADVKLRQAVAKSIDRAAIANRLIGQIVPDPQVMGNHIYPVGSKYYQDNSAGYTYDPQGAAADLDALGWKLDGAVRKKDGKPLEIRYVATAGNPHLRRDQPHGSRPALQGRHHPQDRRGAHGLVLQGLRQRRQLRHGRLRLADQLHAAVERHRALPDPDRRQRAAELRAHRQPRARPAARRGRRRDRSRQAGRHGQRHRQEDLAGGAPHPALRGHRCRRRPRLDRQPRREGFADWDYLSIG